MSLSLSLYLSFSLSLYIYIYIYVYIYIYIYIIMSIVLGQSYVSLTPPRKTALTGTAPAPGRDTWALATPLHLPFATGSLWQPSFDSAKFNLEVMGWLPPWASHTP